MKYLFVNSLLQKAFLACAIWISSSFAIDSPFFASATLENNSTVKLIWRINDFSTNSVIILRRITGKAFTPIDTISNNVMEYKDAFLESSTQFYYALIGIGNNTVSDTSNIILVTTPPLSPQFKIPQVSLSWIGQNRTIINYLDSCSSESGFRLFRKEPLSDFSLIATQVFNDKAWMGTRTLSDSSVLPNSWYIYKVEAFEDTQSLVSSLCTLFTYMAPTPKQNYTISRNSEIPIYPPKIVEATIDVGFVEVIGDSLYVLEMVGEDTVLTEIDISDQMHPVFKEYLSLKNIPKRLENVAILLKFKNLSWNGDEARSFNPPWNPLVFSDKRNHFIINDNILSQFDSTGSVLLDTIKTFKNSRWQKILDSFSDSTLIIQGNTSIPSNKYEESFCLCSFSNSNLKIISNFTISSHLTFRGALSKKLFFSDDSGNMHIIDYSFGNVFPYYFKQKTSSYLFPNIFNRTVIAIPRKIDPFSALGICYGSPTLAIFPYDIRDTNCTSQSLYMDPLHKGAGVHTVILDTNKHRLFVISTSTQSSPATLSIYSYEKSNTSTIQRYQKKKVQYSTTPILSISNRSYMIFPKLAGQIPIKLEIYNLKGNLINSILINSNNNFIWNCKIKNGTSIVPGSYILRLRGSQFDYSKKITLLR